MIYNRTRTYCFFSDKKRTVYHPLFSENFIILLVLLLFSIPLFASSPPSKTAKSKYILLHNEKNASSILSKKDLISFDAFDQHLNFGFSSQHLWIKPKLHNRSDKTLHALLVLDNPLLEIADLYCQNLPKQHQGLLQRESTHTLSPAFKLDFAPHEELQCLLHIHNRATTLQIGLTMQSLETFKHSEQFREDLILFFLGMLCSTAILSFLMYLYAKDSSYLLYIFYLATLVFQQVTYTGFLPSLAPLWFNKIDNALVVPKVAVMIVAAALYSRAFLRTQRWKKIDRVYKFFIWFTLLQIPLVGTSYFYLPEMIVLTGLFFVLFNTYAGIAVYNRGCKSARFFVLAWLLLAPAYVGMILDAFGLVSLMYRFPMLIMALTTFEAILLLLAFVDRFYHYQLEKLAYEKRYNQLLTDQKEEVENRVALRTAELKNALDEKETLFQELHHRVKNNLQLILSIVRLQRNRAEQKETKEVLQTFEQRVTTIANTHEMLQYEKGHETVQMQPYLQNLCTGLVKALSKKEFIYKCDSDVKLPLREAIYVGLIINELITNLLKHFKAATYTAVTIILQQTHNKYQLQIKSPNREKAIQPSGKGLGLLIVKTLVEQQLEGTLHYSDDNDIITIRFEL